MKYYVVLASRQLLYQFHVKARSRKEVERALQESNGKIMGMFNEDNQCEETFSILEVIPCPKTVHAVSVSD